MEGEGRGLALGFMVVGGQHCTIHLCLFWLSGKSPLNCKNIFCCSPSNVNQGFGFWVLWEWGFVVGRGLVLGFGFGFCGNTVLGFNQNNQVAISFFSRCCWFLGQSSWKKAIATGDPGGWFWVFGFGFWVLGFCGNRILRLAEAWHGCGK